MATALIDGDIVAYRCAAANDKEDVGIAIWQADQLLSRILQETEANDYRVYLSGDNNFRYGIYPDYKANRRDVAKPRHLESIREFLVLSRSASICDGYEADDALGMVSQSEDSGDELVICSIDKDLLQLPGLHYNFVKREFTRVDRDTGWYNFYYQCLLGDPTDNVRGCPGIGKAKAPRILGESSGPRGLYVSVCLAYKAAYTNKQGELNPEWESDLHRNAKLLYIWRKENDEWTPPPEQEAK